MWQAGRSIGLAASAATFSLWLVFLFSIRIGIAGVTAGTYAVAALMLGLALVGAVAAWKARPLCMFLVFALCFIPVGLYTLGVPGSLKWVGVSNTLLLVSGLLMLAKRKPAAA